MSLAERLAAPPGSPHAMRCTLGLEMRKLSEEDRSAVEQALADPDYTSTAISRALQAEEVHVSGPAIARHRRGGCRCGWDR